VSETVKERNSQRFNRVPSRINYRVFSDAKVYGLFCGDGIQNSYKYLFKF